MTNLWESPSADDMDLYVYNVSLQKILTWVIGLISYGPPLCRENN